MESSEDRARRIRRNVILIIVIMSAISSTVVIAAAISAPELIGMALLMALTAVVVPVIGYLYTAKWYGMLDK